MPTKPTANKEVNAFAKGIITEASPLNFPEGASFDEANFEINRDGTRQRRLGIDYEPNNAFNTVGGSSRNGKITTYVWENAGPQQDKSILVVQLENTLLFFDNNTENPSDNKLGISKAISYNNVDSDLGDREYSYTTINGHLIVANLHPENTTPTVFVTITYDGSTFDVREGTIIIRDKFGIEDDLAVTTNPDTLEGRHRYNLYNQGWSNGNITGYNNEFPDAYPSNVEIDHLGKYTDVSTGKTEFAADMVAEFDYGTRRAPKGSAVISAFARGEYRLSSDIVADPATFDGIDYTTDEIPYYENLAGTDYRKVIRFDSVKKMTDSERFVNAAALNTDRDEDPRVGSVASAFGRVWFGGVSRDSVTEPDELTPDYSSYVFFSQTVEKLSDICNCYSENDPTSEEFNDIIDTDGGFINIVEANNIVALKPFGQFLIVFAENGIWTITGGELGFSPTSFQVNKISDAGVEGPRTIVNADDIIMFWGRGGIYAITLGQASFGLEIQNISETSIQSFYDQISPLARFYATSIYLSTEKKIKWLYNSDPDGTYGDNGVFQIYDKELILDKTLGAFYVNTFPIQDGGDGPYISGIFEGNNLSFRTLDENVVTSSNEEILDSNDDNVITTTTIRDSNIGMTKYLTNIIAVDGSIQFTASELNNTDFLDWEESDGVGEDTEAYLLTGYFLENDSQRKKAIKYLTTHFNRTETGFVDDGSGNLTAENESSCLVRVRWDFADHPRSGKYSTQFEAYRYLRPYFPERGGDMFNYGQSVITTKNKIRGSGRSMQLEFRSSPGKDCQILGWGMSITGNQNV